MFQRFQNIPSSSDAVYTARIEACVKVLAESCSLLLRMYKKFGEGIENIISVFQLK